MVRGRQVIGYCEACGKSLRVGDHMKIQITKAFDPTLESAPIGAMWCTKCNPTSKETP